MAEIVALSSRCVGDLLATLPYRRTFRASSDLGSSRFSQGRSLRSERDSREYPGVPSRNLAKRCQTPSKTTQTQGNARPQLKESLLEVTPSLEGSAGTLLETRKLTEPYPTSNGFYTPTSDSQSPQETLASSAQEASQETVDSQERLKGRLLLLGVAALWASYGVLARDIFLLPQPPPASLFMLVRKVIAASSFFLLQPLVRKLTGKTRLKPNSATPKELSQDTPRKLPLLGLALPAIVLPSIELGLWHICGNSLQALGLEQTSATSAGFVIQTTNVIVPVLSSFSGETVRPITWLAAVLAMTGVTTMGVGTEIGTALFGTSSDPSNPKILPDAPLSSGSILGDLLVLSSALFYSFSTVRLSRHVQQHDPYSLATGTMISSGVFALLWATTDIVKAELAGVGTASLFQGWVTNPGFWAPVLASAFLCGTVSGIFQAYGQRTVPPSQAQILYSLQPIFSAALASTFLEESLPALGYVGGGMVIAASLLGAR